MICFEILDHHDFEVEILFDDELDDFHDLKIFFQICDDEINLEALDLILI
jgi:hypothetical protein